MTERLTTRHLLSTLTMLPTHSCEKTFLLHLYVIFCFYNYNVIMWRRTLREWNLKSIIEEVKSILLNLWCRIWNTVRIQLKQNDKEKSYQGFKLDVTVSHNTNWIEMLHSFSPTQSKKRVPELQPQEMSSSAHTSSTLKYWSRCRCITVEADSPIIRRTFTIFDL